MKKRVMAAAVGLMLILSVSLTGCSGRQSREEKAPSEPVGTNQNGTNSAPDMFVATPGEDGYISLPYRVRGTSLEVQSITAYGGPYLEDGSHTELADIALIYVTNVGREVVEYAEISIGCDGETLVFSASTIPVGATVAVREKNKAGYWGGKLKSCTAAVAMMPQLDMSEASVRVEENENGSLTVTNLTGADIPTVRVFYKYYDQKNDLYDGGITFTAKITGLGAGESRQISPSHYTAGSSKVMMVRIFDTVQ